MVQLGAEDDAAADGDGSFVAHELSECVVVLRGQMAQKRTVRYNEFREGLEGVVRQMRKLETHKVEVEPVRLLDLEAHALHLQLLVRDVDDKATR